ncbi:unnamed protein product [Prorocentrum cordatum]|uniref:Uncharacterized protein n=1 Tax=Prorocentrum cordatum TaxID=2364126 RepID=A0ABN9SUD0_9DINO|nr:unnamed protein product [Polarella glacialis]
MAKPRPSSHDSRVSTDSTLELGLVFKHSFAVAHALNAPTSMYFTAKVDEKANAFRVLKERVPFATTLGSVHNKMKITGSSGCIARPNTSSWLTAQPTANVARTDVTSRFMIMPMCSTNGRTPPSPPFVFHDAPTSWK